MGDCVDKVALEKTKKKPSFASDVLQETPRDQ